MATPEEVAQVLGMLSVSFPNFKLPPESMEMYTMLLKTCRLMCCALRSWSAPTPASSFLPSRDPREDNALLHPDSSLRPAKPGRGGRYDAFPRSLLGAPFRQPCHPAVR